MKRWRASPRLVRSIVLLLLATTAIFAENIDPNNDGSRYAWSENLGWLNARPGGPSGPGGDAWAFDLGSREENGGLRTFNLWVWPVRNGR